ncbi:MAG: nucleoside 2-deoxyribosyltransferase domain-containing protein [bacterium]
MALIIQAPNEVYSIKNNTNKKLFIAGGITNCPDWQSELISYLEDIDNLTIYNPRRENFPIHDPKAAEEQITWEYLKLKESDIISFWFSSGSLNPIVLYELGKWGTSETNKKIVVGVDPDYERKQDVRVQTKLAKPDIFVVNNLESLSSQIKCFLWCM